MSNRTASGLPLWDVRWPGGEALFVGTLAEVAAYISARHRETGLKHAAMLVE